MTVLPQLSLSTVNPDQLTIYTNPRDPRRDLHAFVNYVKGRSIKRSYRGNDLPQADYKRLLQVIPDGNLRLGNGDDGAAFMYGVEAVSWIDYLDHLALQVGLVSYDTEGTYRGYSSAEPSFPDNFMAVNDAAYNTFLALSLAEQERRLLDTLVDEYSSGKNEFYTVSVRGRLDRFPGFGSAIGVMPTLNFAATRRFLLELLLACEPGVWYSTADLVAYLKATHPFFLIPQPLKPKKPAQAVEKRYGNFYEGGNAMYSRNPIPDDAPDGFERVEGRYVERFLEGIPLTLGYLDVAYADPASDASKPSRGLLRAFRLNERFLLALRGEIAPPRVTVQPNFEIYIESAFYPASLLSRLAPFADILREDTATVLKLRKQRVAAYLAEHPGLDLVALLVSLAGQALPQNVAIELQDWAGYADVFTLYEGFGLVEARDPQRLVDTATAQQVGDGIWLVRHPGALFDHLMESGTAALRIRHGEASWTPVPAQAHTIFPRTTPLAEKPKKKTKQAVTLKRETLIVLHFPDDGLFEVFRNALLEARSIIDINKEKRTLTLAQKDEAPIKALIQRLSGEYSIHVEDMP